MEPRVVIDREGRPLGEDGGRRFRPDQFVIPHSIADKQDNNDIADRNNWRIKVYDTDLNLKKTIVGMHRWVPVSPPSPVSVQR
jgi:hypothetical protein